jgi:hypothetical protein
MSRHHVWELVVERVALVGTESEGIDISADRPAAGEEQQAPR